MNQNNLAWKDDASFQIYSRDAEPLPVDFKEQAADGTPCTLLQLDDCSVAKITYHIAPPGGTPYYQMEHMTEGQEQEISSFTMADQSSFAVNLQDYLHQYEKSLLWLQIKDASLTLTLGPNTVLTNGTYTDLATGEHTPAKADIQDLKWALAAADVQFVLKNGRRIDATLRWAKGTVTGPDLFHDIRARYTRMSILAKKDNGVPEALDSLPDAEKCILLSLKTRYDGPPNVSLDLKKAELSVNDTVLNLTAPENQP